MIRISEYPGIPRYIRVIGDRKELMALGEHLNKIPQYQLLPNFRGVPRPEVFLHYLRAQNIYYCNSGLWHEVEAWCKGKGVAFEKDINIYSQEPPTRQAFIKAVEAWDLNIKPRQYQLLAAWKILNYKESLSELATRSGKTLIMYMVMRYAMENMGIKKILLVVPSIHLVKQGVEDLSEYREFFKTEQVWAKGEYVETSNLTIGTFQSLVKKANPKDKKYDPDFFKDYDMVIIDEAHKGKCYSIQQILNCLRTKIRFGVTGTLPPPNTIDWFCVQALMGPRIQRIQAIDLIEEGYLAVPDITQIRLVYDHGYEPTNIECGEYLVSNYLLEDKKKVALPKDKRRFTIQHQKVLPWAIQEERKLYSDGEYIRVLNDYVRDAMQTLVLENMMGCRSVPKLELIRDIITKTRGNIIIFAHNTEYIGYLKDWLTKQFPSKKVYKITGSDTIKKRQGVIDKMLESDDVILVGSIGVVGTGLTFKNVSAGIFAQSFKSEIINKQSLGRLMLRTKEKTKFYLYDLIDVFPTKKIYLQGVAKIKMYKEAGYDPGIKKIITGYRDIFAEQI